MEDINIVVEETVETVNIAVDELTDEVIVNITEEVDEVLLTVIEHSSITIIGAGDLNLEGIVIHADGLEEYDPASGQNIIMLPKAGARYLLFHTSGFLFPALHYTRDGVEVTLLTGDISPDDKFFICEIL